MEVLWSRADKDRPYKEPSRSTTHAAAFDVYLHHELLVEPGQIYRIGLNLTCFMPENMRAQFVGRSGLSSRYGMVPLGGLIDADYAGEWVLNFVLVPEYIPGTYCQLDMDREDERFLQRGPAEFYRFEAGERIAQVVFTEVPKLESRTTDREYLQQLHERRGSNRRGGHGSTGRF